MRGHLETFKKAFEKTDHRMKIAFGQRYGFTYSPTTDIQKLIKQAVDEAEVEVKGQAQEYYHLQLVYHAVLRVKPFRIPNNNQARELLIWIQKLLKVQPDKEWEQE